jgi:hypothetical protein
LSEKTGGSSPDLLTKKWAFLAILLAVPVFFLFAYSGDPGRGRAAAISVGVIVIAVRARWDLKNNPWFWTTVAIIAACHILLVLFVPWTSRSYPGYALLPVGVLDFAIIYGAIKLAEGPSKMARSDNVIK